MNAYCAVLQKKRAEQNKNLSDEADHILLILIWSFSKIAQHVWLEHTQNREQRRDPISRRKSMRVLQIRLSSMSFQILCSFIQAAGSMRTIQIDSDNGSTAAAVDQ